MLPPLTESSKRHLINVSQIARDMLRPLAEVPILDSMWNPEYVALGTHEGLAILLTAAEFPSKEASAEDIENGEVSKEYDKGTIDSHRLFENLMGLISTGLVVVSVSMTISITLCTYAVTTFDPKAESFDNVGFYAAWSRQGTMLHIFHWIQQLFLAASVSCGAHTVMTGFFLYGALGVYCVTLESKYELLFENITELGTFWVMVAMSVQSFLFSLPFMMARISPVGCFCSLIPLVVLWITWINMGKMANSYAIMQWKTARRLLNIYT